MKVCHICNKSIEKGEEYAVFAKYNKEGKKAIEEFTHVSCNLKHLARYSNDEHIQEFMNELGNCSMLKSG